MTDRYILDENGTPKPEPDLRTWGEWYGRIENRRVAKEIVGPYEISTVFLALDHSFGGDTPILWETMVFGEGPLDQEMRRCGGSREQAEAMHSEFVDDVRRLLSLGVVHLTDAPGSEESQQREP